MLLLLKRLIAFYNTVKVTSFCSTKGFRAPGTRNRAHQRAHSAPITMGPPISQVPLSVDENTTSHKEEMQLDPDRFGLALDLDDVKGDFYRKSFDDKTDWYLNPVHRPSDLSIPLSELIKNKPLTASVIKAATDGTLTRDYNEDIAEVPLSDFNMAIFKETEMQIQRSHIRRSLNLCSPFELELTKLKMEKLKLEEAYLLKMKCKAELEETRGPKPRWYEIRTKQFNTEIRKYNDLLENPGIGRSLMDYRNSLIEASGRWGNLRQ